MGFWQAVCSPTSLTSWRASRRSSASTSKPSSSTGTPITRARVPRIAVIIPMKLGRLDHRDVARLERRLRAERDRLLRAGRDHHLVRVLGVAELAAAGGDLLAQVEQSLAGR